MKIIKKEALVPFPVEFIFDIINDVSAYPAFLPWCANTTIHHQDENTMDASIEIKKGIVHNTFRTKNHINKPERIEITLQDGPFSALSGNWSFKSLASGCHVQFEIHFQIKNKLINHVFGGVFEHIADTMLEAFCARAHSLHDPADSA